MAALKRMLRSAFARLESGFEAVFGARNNPLVNLGALGWFFFWIAAATGIYLYIFFDTGISRAYESIEYMTREQWYAAGIARSLHRYASDALVVVVALHIVGEFAFDRLRGKRFFAWVTGVPVLALIYVCGISGYWLVWDVLAQYIAIVSTEWLDVLPIFGEPIANNFLDSSTLGDRFFTLVIFIHIFVPLFMLLLMWVHIQRHAGARVNPPRPLALGTLGTMLALSIVYPAVSQAPADLDVVPAVVGLDWFYLLLYPLIDGASGAAVWIGLAGGFLLLLLLPWLPPARKEPVAEVSLDNCNGCGRCVADCPYSAITLEPRSDGLAFDTEAVVDADLCVSCGICAGACPTATPFRRAGPLIPGIELPQTSIADLRERTSAAFGTTPASGREPRILVYACEHAGASMLEADGAKVVSLPCVGMLPPSFLDYSLSRKFADGVMLAGCAENACYHRLGDEWVRQRIAGQRDPYLRKRVSRERLRLSWLPAHRGAARQRELEEFAAALRNLTCGAGGDTDA